MQEGVAGREAEEPAEQTGAGGPEHLPQEDRRGETGDPTADRDEAVQVSGRVQSGAEARPSLSVTQGSQADAGSAAGLSALGIAWEHTRPSLGAACVPEAQRLP